jgi:hypothetical protein
MFSWTRYDAPALLVLEIRMDAFRAVDEFLAANYRIGLEEALCGGCLAGRLVITLADVATIAPRLVKSTAEDDGGANYTYEGTLTVSDVSYRFRCHIFLDRGGLCFLSDIAQFEAIEWRARLAVGNWPRRP